MRRMMACAGQMEVTLHRAFDYDARPVPALEDAVSLWLPDDPVPGQAANAASARRFGKAERAGGGRIDLTAACGVKRTNTGSPPNRYYDLPHHRAVRA